MSPETDRSMKRKNERGVYLGWFAILLPLFVAVAGLGVDTAHYRLSQMQLQNAADAAALAGAKSLNATPNGRISAVDIAGDVASQHTVDGAALSESEVFQHEAGRWGLTDSSFTTAGVSDAAANAIRVSVRRDAVQSFFSPILSGSLESRSFAATATAVAGGAGAVGCAAPIAIASCVLNYDSSGNLICPSNLSFQNGVTSVGLTHPDGTSPVNGNNTKPYIKAAVDNPLTCDSPSLAGTTIFLQNGNDLAQASVNDINAATNNGANPVPIVVPVIDKSCGSGGPTYNQSATIVGYVKLSIVGARWTGAAPAAVAAACPTLGKKNICVKNDCSTITGASGGGTVQVDGTKVYLVR
jgi:Flp pilus assembly protein TadG